MTDHTDRAPAVSKALTVLDALAHLGPSSLAEIVERSGLNKSSVYYILKTLVARSVADYSSEQRLYRLGPALLGYGAAAAAQFDELALTRRELSRLSADVEATLVVYRRVDAETITIVDRIEYPGRVRITVQSGERIPIQGGAFGRAFLAYDSEEETRHILRNGLQSFTPKSVTDVTDFLEELKSVRSRGWAVDHDGYVLGISSVAAPVFSPGGDVVTVIAIVGFTDVIDDARAAEFGAQLTNASRAITEHLRNRQHLRF